MQLIGYLDLALIDVELEANTKEDALVCLVELMNRGHVLAPTDTIVKALLERESLASTGIGHAIAVPHCKVESVEKLTIAIGRFKEPVEFAAIDGIPVKLFFLLIAPKAAATSHLKALAKIARFAKNQSIREGLLSTEQAGSLFNFIEIQDQQMN